VVMFGGATGDGGRYTINNDAYLIDVRNNSWRKLVPAIDSVVTSPSPRAAHCASCVDSMQMVVYGGAMGGGALSSDELYLLDVRSIEKTGQFSWMTVPTQGPTPGKRYGHSMVYSKPLLIVFGGNNGQSTLNDIWTLDVEKSSPFSWVQVKVIDPTRAPVARVYHSADICTEGPAAGMTVIFGGRTGENKSLKDAWGLRQHRDGRWDWIMAPTKQGSPPEPRYQHCCVFYKKSLIIVGGRGNEAGKRLPTSVYDTETCEWKDIPGVDRFRHSSWIVGHLLFSYGGFNHVSPSSPTADLQVVDLEGSGSQISLVPPSQPPIVPPALVPPPTMASLPQSSVGIAQQVYVSTDTSGQVRRVGIETLGDESRKVGQINRLGGIVVESAPSGRLSDIVKKVLVNLLQPSTWKPVESSPVTFFLSSPELIVLSQSVLEIVRNQPMVLQVRAPIKVFGDLHGQFPDLMRLFAKYGSPSEDGGDIDAVDYLFLGDFVDRGSYSLETLTLLFALKCKYPNQVHLIRGNHEDMTINTLYGFKDECRRRLREDVDSVNSAYFQFNSVFEYLPCGAVIDGKVLCIHGGIGGSIESVADIANLPRPLKVSQTPSNPLEQKITDLLWSDPTDADTVPGVTMNETRDPDGSGRIVKFGPDRVDQFLRRNEPLELIIRAHECVMDGFERFARGKLITLFSATDYCGHHKNAGALLFIKRDLTVVPKLIYPTERSSTVGAWDSGSIQARPPTPPRSARGEGAYQFENFRSGTTASNEAAMLAYAHSHSKRFAD
jgi:protein phosphatase